MLDLDETLVHASECALERPADLRIAGYHVYKRPHVDAFVDFAFSRFRVGVWTSSGELYARPLVAQLMPGRTPEFVWSAKRCTTVRNWETGHYSTQKRLAKLKRHGFRLDQIIGVDDTASKYAQNYGNLVLVQEYTGDLADDELAILPAYLEHLAVQPNVRSIEKRRWRDTLERSEEKRIG